MTVTTAVSTPWAMPHFSIDNLVGGWMSHQTAFGAATAWGTSNRAIYVPVRVPRACVVLEMGVGVGSTATGNIDIGLYSVTGTRLVSTGSTAKTTSTTQVIDVTNTTIGPGLYYIGLNNDTTTDTFFAITDGAPIPAAKGVITEALGSLALPATATWAVDNTLAFVPLVTALLVTEVS